MKPLPITVYACVCLLWAATSPSSYGHVVVDDMTAKAEKFLASLDAEQKTKAIFEFKEDERANWHFVPKARKGLAIGQMRPEQRALAHTLLQSGMSTHGYEKATNIMALEAVLRELEKANPRMVRDPELYYFSFFGKPNAKGTWGWRVEGHHLSINVTIVDGHAVAVTPSFFGSNPATVRQGPRQGWRVLAEEEDMGRQLVKSLTAEQRKRAIMSDQAPKDIITLAERKVKPLEQAGIARRDLKDNQAELLQKTVKVYVQRYRPELADQDLKKIEKAGWDKVYFAWAGGQEPGEGHYYRVQGPTFLMEYDNTQNDANHIHAVWRDFDGDFGENLLQQHYEQDHKASATK